MLLFKYSPDDDNDFCTHYPHNKFRITYTKIGTTAHALWHVFIFF